MAQPSRLMDFMIAIDVDGRVIAKIDAGGLKEVYQKLLECSGRDLQERLSKAVQRRLERLRNQGDAYAKDEQFAKAIESYTKALAIEPSDATIYLGRGSAYGYSGDYEKAIEDYTKALTIKSDYEFALFWRAMAYGELKKWELAIADLTRTIALKPNNAANYSWRGSAYGSLGDYERALADLARSIELKADASAYSKRGQVYDAMNNPKQAIIEYTKAIEIAPADEREGYLFNRALTYDDLKEYGPALADLTLAIKLSPNEPRNHKWRGIIRGRTGDFDAGLKDLNRAVALNPDADTYYRRGTLYEMMGKQSLAIADASKSIDLDPNAQYYQRRAAVYENNGNYDLALQDCNMAIQVDSSDAGGFLCRSRIYRAIDRLQDAKKDLDQALTLDPRFAVAYRARALVELYSGNTARAINDLHKAVELEPNDSYSAMWLEIASRRGGKSGVLAESLPNLDMNEWPAPLVKLMMGRTTAKAALEAAKNSNPKLDREQRCEANFYIGVWESLNGSQEKAREPLAYAVANCPHRFLEWAPARWELRALEDARQP